MTVSLDYNIPVLSEGQPINVGVIGRGFVGGSIFKFLTEKAPGHWRVRSYDLSDDADMATAYDLLVRTSDIIYLCLPTPMDKEGKCCLDIVHSAAELLNDKAKQYNKIPTLLIKSTMVPGTTEKLQEAYPHLFIVTNPEFLTERSAYEDLKNSTKHVLGFQIDANGRREMLDFYHKRLWPEADIIYLSSIEAELVKYLTNSYFAVKVSFANHIYQLSEALGVDYNSFINKAISADPRIEQTHWQVPGPDGKLGFGGSCFPKDLNGMITLFKEQGLSPYLLQTALNYNSLIRPEKDWEQLVGRAVVKEE